MFDRPLNSVCVATGLVRQGLFYLDDKRSFSLNIGKLPDGPAIMRLEPADEARSLEDNRRYWGTVVTAIAKHTGNTKDDVHDYYRKKFNDDQQTRGLSEEAFRTYVDYVMADAAAEHGVIFPVPEVLFSPPLPNDDDLEGAPV